MDGSIGAGGPEEKERLDALSDLGNGAKREPELRRRVGREEKERREREKERESGEDTRRHLAPKNFFPKLTPASRAGPFRDSFDTIGRFLPPSVLPFVFSRSTTTTGDTPTSRANNKYDGSGDRQRACSSGSSRSRTINPKV